MSATPTPPRPGAVDTLPLMSELETAPSFRIAFRGYDAREVDRWTKVMEAKVEAARVAHRELAADVRSLADQLDRAHEELAVLRRRPSVDDKVGFRHLGPRVEQILAEAHAEADEIVRSANASAQELRQHTEEQLRTTREMHARAVAEYEAHRRWLQEEELRWSRLLRSRKEAADRADEYRVRVRRDAEELLETATAQHERVVAAALARTEHLLNEATTQAAAIREAAHRSALAEQEAAVAERAEAERERDEAHREWDEAHREREAVRRDREAADRGPAVADRGPAAADREQAPDQQRDETAAAEEAVGSAELGHLEPVAATAAVGTRGDEESPERARGVAKVVYVVNPGESETDEAAPAEPKRSTVDAR
jgi:hypothetical protein